MSDNSFDNYGKEQKYIMFRTDDDVHARLTIRLRHWNLKLPSFFRAVASGIIEEDPHMLKFIEEYAPKHTLLNKKRFAKSLKLRKTGEQKLEDFGLTDTDKAELFDIIAEDLPDL